jgi:hypothetical protein
MPFPSWIVAPLMKVVEVFFPPHPKLVLEIRQACLERVIVSLVEDFSDYTFDLYIFLHVWVANQKPVPTTIKEWQVVLLGSEQTIHTEHLEDISNWHQVIKRQDKQHGLPVIRESRNRLDRFPAQPLQQGIAAQGWECFIARGIREATLREATLQLTIVDSFRRNHSTASRAPWPCRGDVFNPELPW